MVNVGALLLLAAVFLAVALRPQRMPHRAFLRLE